LGLDHIPISGKEEWFLRKEVNLSLCGYGPIEVISDPAANACMCSSPTKSGKSGGKSVSDVDCTPTSMLSFLVCATATEANVMTARRRQMEVLIARE
jgi:hypothetical protein